MKGSFTRTLLFIAFICLISQNAFAGAWTIPQYHMWGEYYFKWDWAKNDFDGDGDSSKKNNDARSWDFIQEPKIEFGVTDRITFLASLEHKESHYKEYGRPPNQGAFARKNQGVSSVKLGAKLKLIDEPFVVSGQVKFFIYPGYHNYNEDDPAFRNQPSIGDGENAVEARILIGKKFEIPLFINDWSLPCYFGAESGYRLKDRDVSNDIPFFFEFGVWATNWLLIKTELDGYLNHDGTGNVDKSYAIWRIGPVFQLLGGDSVTREGRLLNIELQYGHTFWGRNTSEFHEIVLKVSAQY